MEEKQVSTPEERREVREVVGVFDTSDALISAIDDLMTNGFDYSTISLLADEQTVREKLGADHIPAKELQDSVVAPRSEYIDPEARNEAKAGVIGGLFYIGAILGAGAVLAAGGALPAAVAGAAIAGGGTGLIGAAIAKWVGYREAQWLEEQMQHGGLLLWARAWDKDKERAAIGIMERNGGRDVHAHSAAAA
ncbi:hypothetical protein LG047_18630 [Methylocystis sp. WRRC1]|uniref:hypothetical protein n=1 Tax=Methylocystis sp. WRRC1 TaxID=1732014 RepID=UPI001D156DEC|nr:hypothetical protein [Methylocystis sp. WRRC1]MCC3247307.1 hypothetical protein [Methylocystis sp. WRRC1]